MSDLRKIIYYPKANLSDLDADTVVAYPVGKERYNYYAVPRFLIAGAQKCGTRELSTWLEWHVNLRGAPQEFHFFNDVRDIETEWTRYLFNPAFLLSKGREHYSAHRLHTFEKTPAYFDCSNRGVSVPKLIRKMMPSGRFIILLRNPTERAYSAYQMGRKRQRFEGPFRNHADGDFTAFIRSHLKTVEQDEEERLVRIGCYALHLEEWFRCFARNRILVLLLEDFMRDPPAVMEAVFSFLELPGFDYGGLMEKNARGLWTLRGTDSKGNEPLYETLPEGARVLLDEYYQPWNERLKLLLPELDIPW